ncbi:hypothetical protein [Spongiibacter thalassae]|nr:hypothetical protein [Spongiibacter thalassae]
MRVVLNFSPEEGRRLMADKNVSGSISGFEKYLDQEKIAELSK